MVTGNKSKRSWIWKWILSPIASTYFSWWIGGIMTMYGHINPLIGSILLIVVITAWLIGFIMIYGRKWIFGNIKRHTRRPLIIINSLLIIIIILSGWITKQYLIESFPQPTPKIHISKFSEQINKFQIFIGSNTFDISLNALKQRPITLTRYGGSNIKAKLDNDDNMYVEAIIDDGVHNITVSNNKYTHRPLGWDINSNSSSVEIVNEHMKPVLQIIYDESQSSVTIYGMFPIDANNLWIATNAGMSTVSRTSVNYSLDRIFKYPSWQYQGELIKSN